MNHQIPPSTATGRRDAAGTHAKRVALIAAMAAIYVLSGALGLSFAAPPGHATVVWPASGLAIAGLLHYGGRLWPGVFIGSFILHAAVVQAPDQGALQLSALAVAAAIAAGSTLQAAIAAYLTEQRFGAPIVLSGNRDIMRLALICGPLACVVAATIGVAALYLGGAAPLEAIVRTWLTWWLGNVIGVLVFLPVGLLNPWRPWSVKVGRRTAAPGFRTPLLLMLVVPLGLTFYAWKATSQFTHERNQLAFATMAHDNEQALVHRLDSYKQSLDGGAGLFRASEFVTGEEWKEYVDALDIGATLPGINGIGFIAPVGENDVDEFVAGAVADGSATFSIHPDTPAPAIFSIRFIEPIEPNLEALGLNIAFEENRYGAAVHARDTGRPTITKRIFLVQDSTRSAGFLLLRPLYETGAPLVSVESRRERFRGWIYAPFISHRFMDGLTKSQGSTLDIAVYDGLEADEDQLIYSSATQSRRGGPARYSVQRRLSVMEQSWTVVWRSTPAFEAGVSHSEPKVVFGAGIALSMLFGALLLSFVRREDTIQHLVRKKTREIEASEERFRSALENAPSGMALVGLDGAWLKVNQTLCDFLGYAEAEFLELDFQTITHPDDLAADETLVVSLLNSEIQTYQLEKRYIHKGGHMVWGLLSVSVARDSRGDPEYFISQIQDINARKDVERIKSEFVATVSHELRTPLTSIRGSLGLVTKSMAEDLPAGAMRLLSIANNNCERLIHLINDILDLEKISSGDLKLSLQDEAVGDLVEQAVEANQAFADQYGAQFQISIRTGNDLIVRVDQARLHQVLANLMSNAAKFSPSGGEVDVIIGERADRARISVADSGPGISPEFRSRIFGRFSQADGSATRSSGGAGLGLHISRELVEQMGGDIGFESVPGEGSTFWVEFPLVRNLSAEADLAEAGAQKPVAIHVEDDADFSEVLALALQDRMTLVNPRSCREARDLLRSRRFDVLIVDIELPDRCGLDLLDEPFDGAEDAPIVIISASEHDHPDPRIRGSFVKSRSTDAEIVDFLTAVAEDASAARQA